MSVHRARNLDELEAQFTAIAAIADSLVGNAGAEICEKRPNVGSWSAAECIDHLNLCADPYFVSWEVAIPKAGTRNTNVPLKVDLWGQLLSWSLEPPARMKARTKQFLEPSEPKEIGLILKGFRERHERILAVIRECEGRAIDAVKIVSPVDARINYSVWSSFLVHAAHDRRHLWQAQQAVDAIKCPLRKISHERLR